MMLQQLKSLLHLQATLMSLARDGRVSEEAASIRGIIDAWI